MGMVGIRLPKTIWKKIIGLQIRFDRHGRIYDMVRRLPVHFNWSKGCPAGIGRQDEWVHRWAISCILLRMLQAIAKKD